MTEMRLMVVSATTTHTLAGTNRVIGDGVAAPRTEIVSRTVRSGPQPIFLDAPCAVRRTSAVEYNSVPVADGAAVDLKLVESIVAPGT
jgi:hypothetical protein